MQQHGGAQYPDTITSTWVLFKSVLCYFVICSAFLWLGIYTEKQKHYSVDEWPFSSVKTESSSDWSLRRSHGRIEEESAISWTGAILGRRPSVPFNAGGTSLGGLVFWRSMATVPVNYIHWRFTSNIRNQRIHNQSKFIINTFQTSFINKSSLSHSLTHASDDAVHRKLRGSVIASPGRAALLLLLVEDESWVLLFSDVDVVAGVCGSHDVARARVQQDALVVFPLYTDETHAVPARQIPAVSIYLR